MKVEHYKFLFCVNIMVYDITFKQRTIHIFLQRNVFIAFFMILYWLIICRLTLIERYLNYIQYKEQCVFVFNGIYSLNFWWGISTMFNIKRYERGVTIIWILLYILVSSLVLYLISTWQETSYDHGYVPLVVNTSLSLPHSWLITGFVSILTLRGVTSGEGTADPSGVPEFTPGF